MTDDELRLAWREGGRRAPGDCPSAEQIVAAAQGAATAEAVRRVAEHLVGCGACSEDWRVAVAAGAEQVVTSRQSSLVSRHLWAATGGLALAAALLLSLRSEPTADPLRGDAPAIQSLVEPGVALPRSAFVLRWGGGEPGATYTVHVAGPGLEPLHDAGPMAAASYTVPAAVLDPLPPGASVYWQVEAVDRDGARRVSPTFSARLE